MKKSPQELIEKFIESVIKQAECTEKGDYKSGNKYADEYISAANDLLAGGDQYIDEFTKILKHTNRDVRCIAAAFLLKDRTKQAVKTLRKLKWGIDIAAMGARQTLKRYKKGILEIK